VFAKIFFKFLKTIAGAFHSAIVESWYPGWTKCPCEQKIWYKINH